MKCKHINTRLHEQDIGGIKIGWDMIYWLECLDCGKETDSHMFVEKIDHRTWKKKDNQCVK